jgi:hypothetical protein
MTSPQPPEREFPNARFDDRAIQSIVTDVMSRFETRDLKLSLRDALLFRRTGDENRTGQYVPPPFDKSKSIIKHATGILIDRAQHLSAKAAENSPNIQVNTLLGSRTEAAPRKLDKAREQENALNAIYWECDQAYDGQMQQIVAFSAVTKGVGWYHSYENLDGWATPSRAYYAELTGEEVERLTNANAITDVFADAGKEFQYAESADHFQRRKEDAQRNAAERGETLFHTEVLPPASVYYRKDTQGISLGLIVEEVPLYDLEGEFGTLSDEHGNMIIGADRGGPIAVESNTGINQTWVRVRLWTRDEVYYIVSKASGGKPSGGRIVFHSKHDLGCVPLWPAAASVTDSNLPEEEYIPLLEGAYAMVPGYNQVLTLLSNAAVFNLIPRYVIVRNDGTPVMDPDTNTPMTFETDNVAGIDPQYAAIVDTGGGSFVQLKIENIGDMLNLVEIYGRALDMTLPPEAAVGSSGAEEPAWGTRLKQAAANIKIQPVVENHAAAVRGMARFWSRIIKHRRQKIVVYCKPEKRYSAKYKPQMTRAEISLNPDDVSLDVSVRQRSSDATERITKMQVGMQLRTPQNGMPVIDDIEFYEEWMESDDPIGDARRATAQQIVDLMKPQIYERVMARVQARLTEPTPNETEVQAQTTAAMGRSDMLPSEPAAAAGIRQPGIEQSMGMKEMPAPGGAM